MHSRRALFRIPQRLRIAKLGKDCAWISTELWRQPCQSSAFSTSKCSTLRSHYNGFPCRTVPRFPHSLKSSLSFRSQHFNSTTTPPKIPHKENDSTTSSQEVVTSSHTPATDESPSMTSGDSQRLERWKPYVPPTLSTLPGLYRELTKARLAGLVALTTMCGYAVAPGTADLTTLFFTTVGTGLCIGSANAINQWLEVPYDAQMSRTRNRVLVRNALTPFHAFNFGVATGVSGVALLATTVNPLTAALGLANIFLYTAVYTPMKRASIANTWVGAVVGAIPPMMGWAASTGTIADCGAVLLAAVLYAWQFPHFNALAFNLRPDYSKAGYRMMAVTDTALNARVALRHSLILFPLGWAAPLLGVTTHWFAFTSSAINLAMVVPAIGFWQRSGEKKARELFFVSLIHLPVFLALMMIHKAPAPIDDESYWLDEESYEDEIAEDATHETRPNPPP